MSRCAWTEPPLRVLASSLWVGYCSTIEPKQQTSIPFDREGICDRLAPFAQRDVRISTSSWACPGWCGMLYDKSRCVYRGTVAESPR